MTLRDVHAHLRHTRIYAPAGDRRERRPTDDPSIRYRYQPAVAQMRPVPFLPGWRTGLKSRITGSDPFFIDRLNGRPMFRKESRDGYVDHMPIKLRRAQRIRKHIRQRTAFNGPCGLFYIIVKPDKVDPDTVLVPDATVFANAK